MHTEDRQTAYEAHEHLEAPAPDVTIDQIRKATQATYSGAHRVARSTLETIGDPARDGWAYDGERAERTVALILGAALLELEAPWRDVVELTQAERDRMAATVEILEVDLARIRDQRDRAQAAYRHVSDVEAEHRARANAAEADLDVARNLAVRLEGELAELTHAAGVALDQAIDTPDEADDRVAVRRQALNRIAQILRNAEEATR